MHSRVCGFDLLLPAGRRLSLGRHLSVRDRADRSGRLDRQKVDGAETTGKSIKTNQIRKKRRVFYQAFRDFTERAGVRGGDPGISGDLYADPHGSQVKRRVRCRGHRGMNAAYRTDTTA